MENTRATKEVTTESGHKITLFAYITGRDKRAIESVFLGETKITQRSNINTPQGEMEMTGATGVINHAIENKAMTVVVKEILPAGATEVINGEKEKIDFILDLPESEYSFVVAEINKITEPKKV